MSFRQTYFGPRCWIRSDVCARPPYTPYANNHFFRRLSPERFQGSSPMFNMKRMLSGLIAAAFCGAYFVHNLSPASAQGAGAPATTQIPAADAQTTEIVNAANAFVATLG